MSEPRIVVERACPVHGLFDQPSHTAYGGCTGSRRRVLTAEELSKAIHDLQDEYGHQTRHDIGLVLAGALAKGDT